MSVDQIIPALCGAVDAESMMAHLAEFARRMKLAGTPQEMESFAYLKSCLDGYGLRTRLTTHEAFISLPGRARLEVDGESPACITHSFSRPSGADGTRGVLVYAGRGTAEELARAGARGKVVLIEGIASPAASLQASQAGAIGQIHISPHEHLHEMCLSSVWGSPKTDQLDRLPSTVVLSVRATTGLMLKDRIARGQHAEVTIHAEVDTAWKWIPLLQADLHAEASDVDDTFVLFSGHHDTWHYGVMDNGGANATMLEVARLLAPHRKSLRRGLRLCFWSGHSQGRYSGSSWYADNHWDELAGNCVAHVNVDSTGGIGNVVVTDAASSAELTGLAAEAIGEHGRQELVGHRMGRGGDQSFWGIGVPSLFMGMGEQAAGSINPLSSLLFEGHRNGAGFGWWWHTPDDLLDKIDPEILKRDTRVYLHALWRLLTDLVLPLDYGRQCDILHQEIAALNVSIDGRLDLTPVISRIDIFKTSIERLARSRVSPNIVNAALILVSRALVPMDYTTGDRFEHDPALTQSLYPVLDPVRLLAASPIGSDASRFAQVAARRALNRLAFALDEANAALASALR